MVNYQNGKIYKIVNDVNDIIYIGSTAQVYLCNRMSLHRYSAKTMTTPFYKAMRTIEPHHFSIHLIKKFPCTAKEELEAEEYRLIDKLKAKGIELYNTMMHGSPSEETRVKMSISNTGKIRSEAVRQRLSEAKTKRGCIHYQDGPHPCWIFQWLSHGKRERRGFSVKKWGGDWGARRMAEYYQNYIFPVKKE